ncbi:transposase family protein [Streptomyces sp. NPDC003032]
MLPHLSGMLVELVSVEDGNLRIEGRTPGDVAVSCPDCGCSSRRRHSGYRRRLADCAIGGRPVAIELRIRRLFCDNPNCKWVTFAEQADGLTERYQRMRTCLAEAGEAPPRGPVP